MPKVADKAKDLDLKAGYKEKYGFHDEEKFVIKPKKGINRKVVEEISHLKEEPK